MPQPSDRTFAEIDIPALLGNLARIKKLSHGRKIIAVVKANCYGHGYGIIPYICNIVDGLGVATVAEGCHIRQIGCTLPVLVLGCVHTDELPLVMENDLSVTLTSLPQATELAGAAKGLSYTLKAHLKINTGMNRLGIDYRNKEDLDRVLDLGNIDCIGVFSHYAVSKAEDEIFHAEQTNRFLSAVNYLSEKKEFTYIHIANSAAINERVGNTVRVGYAVYGYGHGLVPVLSWKARVVQINNVLYPEGVGYGRTFIPENRRKIATVSVGYGDGYPRSLSNSGKVLFHSREYPIVGRVCMDMLFVDVTNSNIQTGDYVTLIGTSGKNRITAEDLGFGYEVLCGITNRVNRIVTPLR